jgi:poly(3-hydroxybutyrate) depolymerase
VGIHSGLAYKSANDVVTAFAAMRGDARPLSANVLTTQHGVRTIVFQGSADQTVSPANARSIVDTARRRLPDSVASTEGGISSGGRTHTRTVITGPNGESLAEYWLIDGAGHAWSGGRPQGSYADPKGPDASTEMMRFFLGQ